MSQSKPEVSVIIPTYNRAELLPRAIKSVLAQTFEDFELIIVDDASTDNTVEVAKSFQEKDDRIKVYELEENSGGAAKPKNVGIKKSKGDYIAFLDSDDEWLPKKLEKQLKLFKSGPDSLGFISCNDYHIDINKGDISIFRIVQHQSTFKEILAHDFMGSESNMFYKRNVFNEIGLFDKKLKTGQTWEIRIRLAQEYDFDFVNEPLVKYYIHDESISKTTNFQTKEETLDYIFKKHKDKYRKYPRVYGRMLGYLGTGCVFNGQYKKAWHSLLKSLKYNPFDLKTYVSLFSLLFGIKGYKKIAKFKNKTESLLRD